jgi:hypothetical protein
VNVYGDRNDQEVYGLPLQRAIDLAIASLDPTVDQAALPEEVMEFPYTDFSDQERLQFIRRQFMSTIIDTLGAAWPIGMIGVVYHLTGFMSVEREAGLSSLIEAMMPNTKRNTPQYSRLLSYHISFSAIYFL